MFCIFNRLQPGPAGSIILNADPLKNINPFAADESVAPRTAEGDSVSIFRAVSRTELEDIQAFGGFRQAMSGRSYESKLFATTAEDARRFGEMLYGSEQFYIVEATVPRTFAERLFRTPMDRMATVSVDVTQLAEFNSLVTIRVVP